MREPLRNLLPGRRLDEIGRLGGSDRSDVRRFADRDSGETLIAKRYTDAGEGWAREAAALAVLPAGAPAPRLVAAGAEPPIVVMTDAGTGGNVADALLGDDPDEAARAVREWAIALAGLHSASVFQPAVGVAGSGSQTAAGAGSGSQTAVGVAGLASQPVVGVAGSGSLRAAFEAELAARAGALPIAAAPMDGEMDDTIAAVRRTGAELGVPIAEAALDDLRGIGRILNVTGAAALTPADTCPDNNVRADGELRLIDFEGAQWRHVAWDVAYLRVPWPSCWCAWRIPDAVAEEGMRAYRQRSALPVTDEQIAVATLGWAFISVAWFGPRALADDPPPADGLPAPTRRAMLMHRLGVAERLDVLPAVAALAGTLRATLRDRWGEVDLAYAPAFAV